MSEGDGLSLGGAVSTYIKPGYNGGVESVCLYFSDECRLGSSSVVGRIGRLFDGGRGSGVCLSGVPGAGGCRDFSRRVFHDGVVGDLAGLRPGDHRLRIDGMGKMVMIGLRGQPLISAGVLLGAGLGGFLDGIVFHQILQWHQMLSARVPSDTVINVKVNMFWDGIFHAAVWLLTVSGLAVLWRAGQRRDVTWSGQTFIGSLLVGWGAFHLVEGLIDHMWLGLHHVHEYGDQPWLWDMMFLAAGAALVWIGRSLMVCGRTDHRVRGVFLK